MQTAVCQSAGLRLLSLSLSLSLCLSSAAAQDSHPLADAGRVTYEFTLNDAPFGREVVEFRKDGWSANGQFGRGKKRVQHTASWTRFGADSGRWQVSGTRGAVRCGWSRDTISVEAGNAKGTEASWQADSPPVFYENMVLAVYSELASRVFAKREPPAPGDTATLFNPRTGAQILVTLDSFEPRRARRAPATVDLFDVELTLGQLPMRATFTAAGLLIALSVQSQNLRVLAKGYEGAMPAGRTFLEPGPWRALLSKPTYEFTKRSGVRAAMRDGVELVADVFLPRGDGPWPTVLVRTPYGRKQAARAQGTFWARRGYAFVVQDVRGCFDSQGAWAPARYEKNDGSDTIDWIVAQDWSDQNVGMIGGSYGGWVQLLAAVSGNPHLKAIVPQVAPPDPLEAFPYEGGAFQLGVAWWALIVDHLANGSGGPPPSFKWTDVLATLPLTDLDQAMGIQQRMLDEWLAHSPADRDYWDRISYRQHLANADVAALHITGWYDGDLPGALGNYPALRKLAKSARSREGQFLVVGPWGHAFNQSRTIGDVDFGPDALVNLRAVYVRFFDRYLKGRQNGMESEEPVLAFVMGSNVWRSDSTWPLTNTQFSKLYLGSDGSAESRLGDGRLSIVRAGSAAFDTFTYSPADPPPTPEVTFGDQLKNSRLMDLSTTVDREDVLDYTSPPLAEAVELVGPVEFVAWVETDAEDTDVCAKLIRIEPDGTARRITGGIQRIRYRDGTDAPVPPGTTVRVTVRLRATGIALAAGDRLRLEVCSSEFPSFDRNPNTLQPAASPEDLRVATTRVLHSREHPSHLVLPIAPRHQRPDDRPASAAAPPQILFRER